MSLLRLSEFVAEKHGIEKSLAKDLLRDAFGELVRQTSTRGQFIVRGFGTFRWKTAKGRQSNLVEGVYIPTRSRLTFKQSKSV